MSRPRLSGTSSFARIGLVLSTLATLLMPLCWKSAYHATGGRPLTAQALLIERGWTPDKLERAYATVEVHRVQRKRLQLALAKARAHAIVMASCVQTSSARPPLSP